MDFTTAIKTCLSKYADFNDRAMRSEYWYFVLFLILTNIVATILDTMLFGGGDIQPLSALWSLAMLLPSLAAGARRLHDIDKSGWWLLLGLIPILGALVLIYWFVQPSQQGTNRFGPAPRA